MLLRKFLATVVVLLGLVACSGDQTGVSSTAPDGVIRSYQLADMTFAATPDLEVSEEEGFYPWADVVWRGDRRGDRLQQIGAMFETAFARNKQVQRGNQRVVVDVQLVRFHGVTNKTRYTVGGVYNIIFLMTVRDAASGAVIEPVRRVTANLDAPGGSEAVRLEQSGQTQKVRVVDFLTRVLRDELS